MHRGKHQSQDRQEIGRKDSTLIMTTKINIYNREMKTRYLGIIIIENGVKLYPMKNEPISLEVKV